MLSIVFGFTACSDDDDDIEYSSSSSDVSTPVLTDYTKTTLTVSSSTGVSNAVTYGFCYSVNSQTPNKNDNVVEADENFTATITGLSAGTTYYIRAYIYANSSYSYSETLEATTEAATLEEQLASYVAPTYVDDYTSIAAWGYRSQWNLSNVHDPSVVLAEDGYYYMYQTDASYGNAHTAGGHFHGRRSKNLVDWEYLGGTMSALPDWVMDKLNEIREGMGLSESTADEDDFGYWAPCVRKVSDGLYRMYYSIVVPGYLDPDNTSWSERAFIGLMETSDPSDNDSWEDKGYVITNASDKSLNFYISPTSYANCYYKWNAIDPSYIITDAGEHWLIYGSWHSGIVALELDPDTGMPLEELGDPWGSSDDEIAEYGQLIATREMGNRWQGSEGPEIVYHDGYYYLFLAYDELSVAYNTRVVRSESITGPYYDITGTDVTNTGGAAYPIVTHPYVFGSDHGWVGISHCAVFDDGNDNWFYASQQRYPENYGGNAYSNAIMMGGVRSLIWTEDGWPVVMPERYGAVPKVAIDESELIGTWENITLKYSYQTQIASSDIVLKEDYTVGGSPFKGKSWSFSPDDNVLTIGDVKLYVQREVDWEASPRVATIVYAGLSTSGTNTYWGKLVSE